MIGPIGPPVQVKVDSGIDALEELLPVVIGKGVNTVLDDAGVSVPLPAVLDERDQQIP